MPALIHKHVSGILRAAAVVVIGLVVGARPSHAQNLVQNFGFETGATTDWIFTPAASGSDFYVGPTVPNGVTAHSGNYLAAFGAIGVLNDTLAQTVPTTSGQQYNFNFWLNNLDGQNASFMTVYWGNQIVLQITNSSANSGWTNYNFVETATGSTTITFAGLNVPAWIALDDVSVTAIPESSTCATILGIVSLGFVMFCRRFDQTASSSTWRKQGAAAAK